MRVGNRVFSVRKVTEPSYEEIVEEAWKALVQKMSTNLRDRDSNLRQMIALVARSAARDALEEMLEDDMEIMKKAEVYARAVFEGRVDPAEPGKILTIEEAHPGLAEKEVKKS